MESAEERIAELKRATEEMKKINAMIKKHIRMMEEGKYAKAEHNGKECKDR